MWTCMVWALAEQSQEGLGVFCLRELGDQVISIDLGAFCDPDSSDERVITHDNGQNDVLLMGSGRKNGGLV